MTTRKHVVLPNPWVIRNTVETHGIREAARILNNRKVVPFWYFYQCVFGKLPRTDAEIHDKYCASKHHEENNLYWGWRIWQYCRNRGFPMWHMEQHLRDMEIRLMYGEPQH